MGSLQGFRQSSEQSGDGSTTTGRQIVAFDFDGTLTIHDSFTTFLRWKAGPIGWALGLMRMAPAATAYLTDRDRGRIKAASVKTFLKGLGRDELQAEAARFADHIWPRFMRPDALTVWNDWGERGAHRVIVTASPVSTVAPFAVKLGADDLIGTEFVFDADGRITGDFAGPNCRGPEKVRRLKAAYGEDMILTAAYGDTSGDMEMLAMAQQSGFRIFTQKP